MFDNTEGVAKITLYILLFPTLFQEAFIDFAWAAGDPVILMTLKRIFLLLPVLTILLGCWITIPALVTVLFRQKRKEYVLSLFITWWDLGKAIVSFWGGIVQFVFNLLVALLELLKVFILGIWYVLQSIVLMPFRLLGSASQKVVGSSIPWIAVFLTLFWVIVETTIFTYVTTPLVVDTMSNITGDQLSVFFIRIPLFTFLFFILLGSYAVLSTFVDSVKKKNVSQIIGIGVIEIIVLFVEVVFLYREFVDALVPWFAMYATDFSVSMTGILAVSTFMWFGIRSLSWFLFASYGTPTIMAVIQGKGLNIEEEPKKKSKKAQAPSQDVANTLIDSIKKDTDWVEEKGQVLLSSFMLPPLQVVAAGINFCTLLVSGSYLFELPFRKLDDIKTSGFLIEAVAQRQKETKAAAPAE
ncbi:MAG: hypothetical protein WEA56_17460 [Balneolaceae bacterium]